MRTRSERPISGARSISPGMDGFPRSRSPAGAGSRVGPPILSGHGATAPTASTPVTSSEVWDEEAAKRYDEDSPEMFSPETVKPTVNFLAELAGSGRALEFAIGTGRIGLPLAARGVPVAGVELSAPMVDQLRKKPGGADTPVAVGDMATTMVPGEFSLVFLVWNSISNLRTQDEQVECFRNAARHLTPGGRFVVAGMRLEGRYADWSRAPFTSESQSHVSVWRKE